MPISQMYGTVPRYVKCAGFMGYASCLNHLRVHKVEDASFNAAPSVGSYTPEDLSGVYTADEIVNAGYSSSQSKDIF